MRIRTLPLLLSLLVAAVVVDRADAQETNPAHAHLGHVMEAFGDTPEGQGLLPTALAEARIAADHAGYALADPSDLEGMQRHVVHVIHALDPSRVDAGPGLGYGAKRATEAVVVHVEMAAEAEEASDNVRNHGMHVATAAGNAAERAERAVTLAEQVRDAGTADEAARILAELHELTQQIISGEDADGSGQVGWREGGLEQAEQHMGFLLDGEGIHFHP